MPRIWTDTLEAHRHEVRGAIMEATVALVAEHGLRGVTMLQIAETTGIGRATLYKYFPDIETILLEWYQLHVGDHLAHLTALRDRDGTPGERLAAVLEGFATIRRDHHGVDAETAALLHRSSHFAQAQHQLAKLLRDLLAECVRAGEVRKDVPVDELATYCLHALGGASTLRSGAAVARLVEVVIAGLRR